MATPQTLSSVLPSTDPTQSFWQTPPSSIANERTTSSLPGKSTFAIIGSGITAAFAARELAAAGHDDIVVLEARETCSGATGRNGGHCQPLFYEQPPDIAQFELENFKYLSTLVREYKIPCEWEQVHGGCHAYFSYHYFNEAKSQTLRIRESHPHLGDLVEIIEDPERFNRLRVPNASGILLQKLAARLSPYKLITWVWENLIERGVVNLQTRTAVRSIDRSVSGDWDLHTDRGVVTSRHILLATNAYTGHLLPDFRSLIVPVQGEMSALRPNPGYRKLDYTYVFVGMLGQDRMQDDYLVQRPTGTNGGQLMFGGGRCCANKEGVNVHDDDYIDKQAASYLRSVLKVLLDDGNGNTNNAVLPTSLNALLNNDKQQLPAEGEWTGIMGFSRDGFPWVGGVPDNYGLWLCAGYTGHGMPNASLCGGHVGRMISAALKSDRAPESYSSLEESRVSLPQAYLLTRERMQRAMDLPELGSGINAPTQEPIFPV